MLKGLFTLFISTFAVVASLLLASAGILGLGVGKAFIQLPANNAVAGTLPGEEVGPDLRMLQGAPFLGAGTGPALIGTRLAAHREATDPVNLLDAAAYPDAFLAMTAAVSFAPVTALSVQQAVRSSAGPPAARVPFRNSRSWVANPHDARAET